MRIGGQRLLDALLDALKSKAEMEDGTPVVYVPRTIAEDLVMIMRSVAKQDARHPEGFTPPSRFEGHQVVAWLRNEGYAYDRLADAEAEASVGRAFAKGFAGACKKIAEDLAAALERGGGDPIDPDMPRRFRLRDVSLDEAVPPLGGVYFPRTGLVVTDMGKRNTGKPTNVEWIDPEPT